PGCQAGWQHLRLCAGVVGVSERQVYPHSGSRTCRSTVGSSRGGGEMTESEHSSMRHRTGTTHFYSEIHHAAKRYIEQHYRERITLTDFVYNCNYSQRSVQRALSWYNTSWQRMVLDQRMMRAKNLLLATADPINKVAEAVGFGNNHSQFSRT